MAWLERKSLALRERKQRSSGVSNDKHDPTVSHPPTCHFAKISVAGRVVTEVYVRHFFFLVAFFFAGKKICKLRIADYSLMYVSFLELNWMVAGFSVLWSDLAYE